MQQKYFFVFGLPRSRTAWFANYFTSECSHCFHEMIGVKFAKLAYAAREFEYVGLAEPNPEVWQTLGDYKVWPTLVIERDSDEVAASHSRRYGTPTNEQAIAQYNQQLAQIVGLRVKYADINTRLEELTSILTPSIKYNRLRAEQLKLMNVQSMVSLANWQQEQQRILGGV